ncbi:CDP-alcohol phosphatidyltransferase family protein [Schaalia sp. 19OD2882]|uniref:CDP-alcohol phosphatidyltransferase family protein n=1 Tax=Schaalia sp. 19OD2882 TaxID=2794089 RepID=UPI001C1EA04F|nr:CDP-alcohol phosphatidyltransferase family protein [Schaalia sp. 19OD2882]QWW19177.1 CDP-alcohol phosphatidyltransferase family protein [Schaalia sp. 19OD2882]
MSAPTPGHTSWSARFRANRARLDAAQKPGNGVPAYTRWVNRRGARLVAAAGAASGMTPNGITFISLAFSVAGMVALVALPDRVWAGIPVAVLLATGYLLDSADGQLARLTGTSSKAGEWLDHVVDAFRTPAIHFTLALALMVHRPHLWWLAVVAVVHGLVASGQFLSQILAEAFIRTGGGTQRRGGTLRSFVLLPTDPGTLCWSFLLWGLPLAHGGLYALLTAVAIAHSAISLTRRHADLRALDEAGKATRA